ncbi:NodB-like proteiny domain-containing protein [Entamoeba marina]
MKDCINHRRDDDDDHDDESDDDAESVEENDIDHYYCGPDSCLPQNSNDKKLCGLSQILTKTDATDIDPNCLGTTVCEDDICGAKFDNCIIITCECADGKECVEGVCIMVESSSEPIISSSEPIVSSSEPIISSSEPIVSSSEPIISSSEPIVSSSEPIISSSEPIISSSEPIISSSEPIVSSSEPIISSSEPIISSSEPIISSSEPIISSSSTQTNGCGNGYCDSGETYETCPEDCANPDYECSSSTCSGPNCRCCTTDNPGGLSNGELPQFIFITVDDSIRSTYFDNYYKSILESGVKDNRDCSPKMTFFPHNYDGGVHNNYQKCEELKSYGCEISSHSYSHPQNMVSYDEVNTELEKSKLYYSELSSVGQLPGYRSPFLLFTEEGLKATKDNGFLYHSGVIHAKEVFGGIPLWPYTYDFGAPNIGWDDNSKTITSKLKGLWEIPLLPLYGLSDEVLADTMDYPFDGDELYEFLKYNLDNRHSSNKAPFGVYLHGPWFTESRTEAIISFINYATSTYEDVYFATGDEIISYMQNPVPYNTYGSSKCGTVTPLECLDGGSGIQCSVEGTTIEKCGACPGSLPSL